MVDDDITHRYFLLFEFSSSVSYNALYNALSATSALLTIRISIFGLVHASPYLATSSTNPASPPRSNERSSYEWRR